MLLTRATLIVPAVAGVLLFAGCASSTPVASDRPTEPSSAAEPTAEASSDQTVAEACDVVEEGMRDFLPLMQEDDLMGAAAADPAGMLAKFETADSTFSAAVDAVSNDEVLEAAEPASDAMHDLVSLMQSGATDAGSADIADVAPMVQTLGTELTALGEVCS